MIAITTFAGKTVAVFGLARSGIVSAEALQAGGADVACWDDGEAGRAAATKAGLPLVDLRSADWCRFAALVLAPGVPLTHPKPHWTVERAKAAGVAVIGDIELFFRERARRWPDRATADRACPVICITGTNGKSTTTALIAHILRSAGKDVQMGGNIGVGVLALEPPAEGRHYVIEMSSFQIDLTIRRDESGLIADAPNLRPTVGVLLNVTPDHLDRHGDFEGYEEIKRALPRFASIAVVDPSSGTSAVSDVGRTVTFEVDQFEPALCRREYYARDGQLYRRGNSHAAIDLRDVRSLRGWHNWQNAGVAFAALSELGLSDTEIQRGMKSFPGLAHRLEELGHVGKVVVVNDSKGTNADSTEKALLSFAGNIYWIAGGVPKEGGIEPLAPLFGRVAKAYLIGQCAPEFARTLEGKVPYDMSGTLDVALQQAVRDAAASTAAEPVVLLSPACASYDQYKSFEQRGDHFRALAAQLTGFSKKAQA